MKKKFNILKNGLVDIYYAFILKCLKLLKNDGVMVSITPNSYFYIINLLSHFCVIFLKIRLF